MAPRQGAVAGATTTTSAVSAATIWPIRPSGSSERTSDSTAWRLNASSVSGATNRVADGDSRTTTSAPSAWRSRSSSTDLNAAIEPVTPSATRRPRRRSVTRSPEQAQLERLAAADLGVEDREALERQVGVDRVDPVEGPGPRRRGQAAGQDRLDVARRDPRRVGELRPDAGEEAGG